MTTVGEVTVGVDIGTTSVKAVLADGAGVFTNAMGLAMDGSAFGLGARSQRYSAIIENGVVKELNVEEGAGITVSACEIVLEHL